MAPRAGFALKVCSYRVAAGFCARAGEVFPTGDVTFVIAFDYGFVVVVEPSPADARAAVLLGGQAGLNVLCGLFPFRFRRRRRPFDPS